MNISNRKNVHLLNQNKANFKILYYYYYYFVSTNTSNLAKLKYITCMNNFNNKSWWDNNPMSYKNWDLSLEKRIANNIDEFRKINEDYLNNNPYLKNLFNRNFK